MLRMVYFMGRRRIPRTRKSRLTVLKLTPYSSANSCLAVPAWKRSMIDATCTSVSRALARKFGLT